MSYDFLTQPLSHNVAARTSRDIARDACYMTGFKRKTPLSERVLIVLGLALIAAIPVFCHFN